MKIWRSPTARFGVDRDRNLDTVRGVACILLVFYHTVGAGPHDGLRLDPASWYSIANDFLAYVRMPLFTFLSGVVYARRPLVSGNGVAFARGKVKRLLVPFICITLLFTIVQKLTPGTNASLEWWDIPRTLVWPYGHLWFIAALLWVFALVGCLDYFRALDKPSSAAILFLIASAMFAYRDGAVGVFAWNRALYLLPFFLTGLVLTRFGWKWAVACASLALLTLEWEITVGALFGVTMLAVMPTVPLLAKIGFFSYSIYLLHVFGTAGARIVMLHAGVDTIPLLLLVGTLAGIVLPIAADLVLARVPFLSRAILGVYPAAPRPKTAMKL